MSWNDSKDYCVRLSKQSGVNLRLPSESEWECASRAGSNREFCFGDDEVELPEYAWFGKTSGDHAHTVGTRRANSWGLHDFHGNVWEWCEDTYHKNYEGAPADATAWSEAGARLNGSPLRVSRGGAWISWPEDCRSSSRNQKVPGWRDRSLGFRPALSVQEDR